MMGTRATEIGSIFFETQKKQVISLQLVVVKHSKLLCNLFDSVTKYRRIQIPVFFPVFRLRMAEGRIGCHDIDCCLL